MGRCRFIIDAHLNFGIHINSISAILFTAVGMLPKIRHFVKKDTLPSIYCGIFSSILADG